MRGDVPTNLVPFMILKLQWGIDHCAAKSVAFHYIKGDLMRRMYAILYHYC